VGEAVRVHVLDQNRDLLGASRQPRPLERRRHVLAGAGVALRDRPGVGERRAPHLDDLRLDGRRATDAVVVVAAADRDGHDTGQCCQEDRGGHHGLDRIAQA
jgi:hypothetical protein